MEYIIDLLKISIPALLVFWAVYSTMNKFFARELEKQPIKNNKETITLRLKAYERLCLFLERITPENLIQRSLKSSMTCGDLQLNLLKNIRSEYEHNLTQQLYISNEAWEATKMAKETLNQLINTAMTRINANSPAIELAKILIETYNSSEISPIEVALRQLKAETIALLS